MNVTFINVQAQDNFETEKCWLNKLVKFLFEKEYYIIVGSKGNNFY